MTPDIAVSIINYRTGPMTLDCLRATLNDLEGLNASVCIVDNASGDGSADLIAEWIAANSTSVPVRLIRSETNSGFSGGHNQTLRAVPARHYLLLNSDGYPRRGMARALLEAARTAPDRTGIFAPRIEHQDGVHQVSCFRFHSVASELARGANTGLVSRVLGHATVALGTDPDPRDIEWVSFACVMLKGDMVADIGDMDEGYFLYFEDAEYGLRARRAGWSIAWCPQAKAVHLRGGSGPVKSLAKARRRLPRYYYASRSRFFAQKGGRAALMAANLAWYLGRAIALARVVLLRRPPPAVAAEWRDIWTNVLSPLKPGPRP